MEIETERLILRRLDSGDLGEMAALFASARVLRHLAVDAMDTEAARDFAAEFIRDSRRNFREDGTGALAVTARTSAKAIGYCGLRPVPVEPGSLELMYALMPEVWGKGIATEAAGACLDWGFRNLDANAVIALARNENHASVAVMEKLGFRYIGLSDRYYRDTLRLHRMGRRRWAARRGGAPATPT